MPPQKERKKKRRTFVIPDAYIEKRIDEPPKDRTADEQAQMTTEDVLSAYMRNTESEQQQRERSMMAKEDADAGRFNRRKVRGDVMLNEDLQRLITSYTLRPQARQIVTQLVREVPDLMRILKKHDVFDTLSFIAQNPRESGVMYDGTLYHSLSGGSDIAYKGRQDYFEWENWGHLNDFKKKKVEFNGRSWEQEEEDFVDMEAQVDRFNQIVAPYDFELGWFRLDISNSANAVKLSSYADLIDEMVGERQQRRDRVRQRKEERRAKRKEERRKEREEEEDEEEEDEEEEEDSDDELVEEEDESEGESDLDEYDYDVGFWGVRGLQSSKAQNFLPELRGVVETTTTAVQRLDAEREQMAAEDEASRLLRAYTGERKDDDDQPPPLEPDV